MAKRKKSKRRKKGDGPRFIHFMKEPVSESEIRTMGKVTEKVSVSDRVFFENERPNLIGISGVRALTLLADAFPGHPFMEMILNGAQYPHRIRAAVDGEFCWIESPTGHEKVIVVELDRGLRMRIPVLTYDLSAHQN